MKLWRPNLQDGLISRAISQSIWSILMFHNSFLTWNGRCRSHIDVKTTTFELKRIIIKGGWITFYLVIGGMFYAHSFDFLVGFQALRFGVMCVFCPYSIKKCKGQWYSRERHEFNYHVLVVLKRLVRYRQKIVSANQTKCRLKLCYLCRSQVNFQCI